MGGETFQTSAKGVTAQAAFNAAVSEARHMHGHGGYSGTIAEKDSFTLIKTPLDIHGIIAGGDAVAVKDARKMLIDFADKMIEIDDVRVSDKWGPAGCIDLGNNEFLFFGWASS